MAVAAACARPAWCSPALADCLESYFTVQGEIPPASPPATVSGSLLDQLPPVGVTARGQAVATLLRPAYAAFGPDKS